MDLQSPSPLSRALNPSEEVDEIVVSFSLIVEPTDVMVMVATIARITPEHKVTRRSEWPLTRRWPRQKLPIPGIEQEPPVKSGRCTIN